MIIIRTTVVTPKLGGIVVHMTLHIDITPIKVLIILSIECGNHLTYITLLSNVGPHNIIVKCYEFNLNSSLPAQLSSISCYIMMAHGTRVG